MAGTAGSGISWLTVTAGVSSVGAGAQGAVRLTLSLAQPPGAPEVCVSVSTQLLRLAGTMLLILRAS